MKILVIGPELGISSCGDFIVRPRGDCGSRPHAELPGPRDRGNSQHFVCFFWIGSYGAPIQPRFDDISS